MSIKTVFSFFWRHIKPYKGYYMVMLLAPFISGFYPFAYNYAIKLFLDVMTQGPTFDSSQAFGPIMLFVAAHLTLDIIWRLSNIAEWKSVPYVRRSIILHVYDYVQHHSFLFFQNNFTGTISSKIKGILDGYDKIWEEMHLGLGPKLLKCIVGLSALAFISIHLGLFVLIWCVVYIPTLYTLSLRLNHLSYLETEIRHSLGGQISDKITNILSLFSFASQKWELEALDQQIQTEFMPRQLQVYYHNFKMQLIAGGLYLILFGFLLFYMLHLKTIGVISVGDFAFVFGISLVVAEDIWLVTRSLQEYARAMGDIKSALSILQIPHQQTDIPHARPLHVKNPTICFKSVTFGYAPEAPLFNNLSLTIQAGEKIGLVGHSGSGKSTLLNLLLRYFVVDKGEITINEQDIGKVTQDSLRQNIAVIPQDTLLFHRSLMENIRYGNPNASDEEVINASRQAHIHDYIISLPDQYDTFVGERGVKLSGGQRQRIAIARAFLKDAPILILDEATSALDSQTEKYIQESLNTLIQDKQKTVVAIAHRLSTLKHMDRILVLEKGSIIEEGSHHFLIRQKNSLYKKLWELQEI